MSTFQLAAQAVVDGNLEALRSLIEKNTRTGYRIGPHNTAQHCSITLAPTDRLRSTCKKHLRTPVEIARFLIANGSHVDAVIGG